MSYLMNKIIRYLFLIIRKIVNFKENYTVVLAIGRKVTVAKKKRVHFWRKGCYSTSWVRNIGGDWEVLGGLSPSKNIESPPSKLLNIFQSRGRPDFGLILQQLPKSWNFTKHFFTTYTYSSSARTGRPSRRIVMNFY